MLLDCVTEHYRVPELLLGPMELLGPLRGASGHFRVGQAAIAFGRTCVQAAAPSAEGPLVDVLALSSQRGAGRGFCFDPNEVVENLRRESYVAARNSPRSLKSRLYYAVRPALSAGLRSRIKRIAHRGWQKKPFPRWPVDASVDEILEQVLHRAMKESGRDRVPFIWFWPRGYDWCAMMTHDVEEQGGLDGCAGLMDLDGEFGIKSSFELVPEGRYLLNPDVVSSIWDRGHEVAVHDWNHDGRLFSSRELFLERAPKINRAAEWLGAAGFRSGALYRNLDWLDALHVEYDMSVPNVAHLDPQPGGCCTVMPYFVGDVLELPVTTVQDYQLFRVVGEYSIDLWREQLEVIHGRRGLANFIIHPDYMTNSRARAVYSGLLTYLTHLRAQSGLWIARPGDVNQWWRQRSRMHLVETNGGWEISGAGSERAALAWAISGQHGLTYAVEATERQREQSTCQSA